MYYVYFAKSQKNGKIYTGYTDKVPQSRINEHNEGTNKFTRNNRPYELIYYEEYLCKSDAVKREKFYKSGFGRRVRNLIIGSAPAKGGSASGGG